MVRRKSFKEVMVMMVIISITKLPSVRIVSELKREKNALQIAISPKRTHVRAVS
jgi:hypothetical protein